MWQNMQASGDSYWPLNDSYWDVYICPSWISTYAFKKGPPLALNSPHIVFPTTKHTLNKTSRRLHAPHVMMCKHDFPAFCVYRTVEGAGSKGNSYTRKGEESKGAYEHDLSRSSEWYICCVCAQVKVNEPLNNTRHNDLFWPWFNLNQSCGIYWHILFSWLGYKWSIYGGPWRSKHNNI